VLSFNAVTKNDINLFWAVFQKYDYE